MIYEHLLRYEGLLLQEKSPGAEPGVRLGYLVPFLLRHGINDDSLVQCEDPNQITEGAPELLEWLRRQSWTIFLITVAPASLAQAFADHSSVPTEQIASTTLSLDRLARYLRFHGQLDWSVVADWETQLLDVSPDDPGSLRRVMDDFLKWFNTRAASGLIAAVKPMGGRRKAYALRSLAHTFGFTIDRVAALGRLPLDRQLLARVHNLDGLAIHRGSCTEEVATVTMSTSKANLSYLIPLLEAWSRGGRPVAREVVRDSGESMTWTSRP